MAFWKDKQNWQTLIKSPKKKKKGQMTQINKTKTERGDVTTDTTEIQRIMRLLWIIICQPGK